MPGRLPPNRGSRIRKIPKATVGNRKAIKKAMIVEPCQSRDVAGQVASHSQSERPRMPVKSPNKKIRMGICPPSLFLVCPNPTLHLILESPGLVVTVSSGKEGVAYGYEESHKNPH